MPWNTPTPCAPPTTRSRHDVPSCHEDPPAARRRYRRGATLLHAGDAGDVLRIEQGLVQLVVPSFDGRDRVLAILGPGDLLGGAEALGHDALVADAVALSAVTVAAWHRAAFLEDLRIDPDRAVDVARSVARRLRAAWSDQARAYRPVVERLAAAMLDLAERFGEPTHDGRRLLRCGLNHHALGALIGAQRASVSTAMAEFRRHRAAFGARGTYTVDLARLRALAGEAAPTAFAPATSDDPLGSSGLLERYTASASHTTTSTPAA